MVAALDLVPVASRWANHNKRTNQFQNWAKSKPKSTNSVNDPSIKFLISILIYFMLRNQQESRERFSSSDFGAKQSIFDLEFQLGLR